VPRSNGHACLTSGASQATEVRAAGAVPCFWPAELAG